MGPACASAAIKPGQATICSASQGTHGARRVLARGLNIPEAQLRVIYLDGAGCYGMNGHDDVAAEAALISRSLSRPVRLQWMREDEHGLDAKGSPQLLDLRTVLDAHGNNATWQIAAFLPMN